MSAEPALRPADEALAELETRLRAQQAIGEDLRVELVQLRRRVEALAEQSVETERAAQAVGPELANYRGLPARAAELARDAEQLRTQLTETRNALATAERTRDAEALTASRELAAAMRQLERLDARVEQLAAAAATRETQLQQLSGALAAFAEWRRETEGRGEEIDLRLQRLSELAEEIEGRVLEAAAQRQERPLATIHERLQILAGMAQRAEERIEELRAERHLAVDVEKELDARRAEYERVEGRVSRAEGEMERLAGLIEEARAATLLVEGRHTGLAERVSLIGRDIAEMVDHVRAEFERFGRMQEQSRRKQIEALEQELREMKAHGPRPPAEP